MLFMTDSIFTAVTTGPRHPEKGIASNSYLDAHISFVRKIHNLRARGMHPKSSRVVNLSVNIYRFNSTDSRVDVGQACTVALVFVVLDIKFVFFSAFPGARFLLNKSMHNAFRLSL